MFKADRKVVMLLAALIVAGTALFAAGEEHTGVISGIVKNASGQAASGAYVKARNAERGLLFMVVSQDQGSYRLTNLPAGNYKVQGIGGTMQSDSAATVVVASGKEVSANLTLNGPRPDRPNEPWRSTGPPLNDKEREALKVHESWLAGRVASQVPEGPGKAIFTSTCSVCHSLPVNERGSREDWAETVADMVGRGAKFPSEQDKETLLNYLAANFGEGVPRSPLNAESLWSGHLSRTLLTGAPAKYKVVESEIPPGAGAHDATVDQEGIAWMNDTAGNGIGRFDPKTLTYTRVVFPKGKTGKRAQTVGIEVDPKGHVWIMDATNERVLEYDPRNQKFNEYLSDQIGGGNAWNTLRILPDGTVWGSDVRQNKVVKLNPATKEFTLYPVPSGVRENRSVRPYGMAVDGAGKLWFAQQDTNRVGKIDPKSGEIAEFPMAEVATRSGRPRRMATDSKGDIWLAVTEANKLVRWDFRTDKYTIFPLPTDDAGPYGIDVDTKHDLVWISTVRADKLFRFDIKTSTFMEFHFPTMDSFIRRVKVDPTNPNRIWYSGGGSRSYDKVGYVEVVE
ncbi:MAG: hypothetical protein A3H28_16630 [Acidobacteria bacterium RIFCSPLOWO2_02_FULL_61_28]|nr:MAG: hypothetical protein A3H28_16630 [Acidobacteria bacterium RIFCSPLOWO2_02_FULL_61_28]